MKLLTITTEFNPFHFGHKKMLIEAKKNTDADAIICLMSGNFVQRGEPAIFDKITRAKCAIASGANLVLEIPTIYSVSDAETFSTYAAKTAASLNSDYLYFGCEAKKFETLNKIADILAVEPVQYTKKLHEELDNGQSFAVARQTAINSLLAEDEINELSHPNNILAIEYLKAIKKYDLNVKPIRIVREETDKLFSATSMRKELFSDSKSYKLLPCETTAVLDEYFDSGRDIVTINDFSNILSVKLRQSDGNLEQPYTEPGLINLMKKHSHLLSSGCVEEFLIACSSRRYTKARIRRVLINLLLNISCDHLNDAKEIQPNYLRILGADNIGFKALKHIRSTTDLVLSEKIKDLINTATEADDKKAVNQLNQTVSATDIYVTAYKNPEHAAMGSEYTSGSYFVTKQD